jgi:hypothetical protein
VYSSVVKKTSSRKSLSSSSFFPISSTFFKTVSPEKPPDNCDYESIHINLQDAIVSGVNLGLGKEIMLEAKSLWNSYTPNLGVSQLAGIDSSWNFIPYQGFYLFAVEAVSILRDCSYTVEPLFNLGVGTLSVEENGEIVYDPERNFKVGG